MAKIFTDISDPELIKMLKNGAMGVLPTDTVYGLVALAANEQSVSRLYALKSREHKPGTIIVANIDQLVGLGIKARYLKAVEQFWPGAVSVVVPVGPGLSYLHQGKSSLAVRIPDNPRLVELLIRTGPLLTTSANHPSEPVANNSAEAQKYFGNKADFYVGGEDLSNHQPSTVIRIVDDAIEVIREGAVKIEPNE